MSFHQRVLLYSAALALLLIVNAPAFILLALRKKPGRKLFDWLPKRFTWSAIKSEIILSAAKSMRPRKWNERVILAQTAQQQPVKLRIDAYTNAYAHALDSGKIEDAGIYLSRARELA